MDVATLERLSDADVLVFCDDNVALAHSGILGMHWGDKNGPPYPLGSGKHSKEQIAAAKATGTQVGKSSGKGSILNLTKKEKQSVKLLSKKKKSELQEEDNRDDKLNGMKWGNRRNKTANESEEKKTQKVKELTPEEKEAKRQADLKSGDIKRVMKVADQSTRAELEEALNRVNTYEKLNKKLDDTVYEENKVEEQKVADEKEKQRQEALKSGDIKRVAEVANQSTRAELEEALNRVNTYEKLNQKLNEVNPPKKSTIDKMNDAVTKAGKVVDLVDNTTKLYNRAAKIYNMFNGENDDLPVFEADGRKQKTAEQKKKEKEHKKAIGTGDFQSILDSIKEYSNSELEEAAKRSGNLTKLEQYAKNHPKTAEEKK